MKAILDKIVLAIEPELEPMGINVDDICYEKEGNYYFLRIILDRNSGLDLDTVVTATNIINPILDELDLIDDAYILDVSSKERGNDDEC